MKPRVGLYKLMFMLNTVSDQKVKPKERFWTKLDLLKSKLFEKNQLEGSTLEIDSGFKLVSTYLYQASAESYRRILSNTPADQ